RLLHLEGCGPWEHRHLHRLARLQQHCVLGVWHNQRASSEQQHCGVPQNCLFRLERPHQQLRKRQGKQTRRARDLRRRCIPLF
ncbi:unnamed protein product, partial [Amoebophrya sp. A25]